VHGPDALKEVFPDHAGALRIDLTTHPAHSTTRRVEIPEYL
jgi:hypothetical protein